MVKKMDYSELDKLYSEKGIEIVDVRNTEYSFLNPPSEKYMLDENIPYGKSEEYPTGYFDWDLYHLLYFINKNQVTLDEAIASIDIKSAYGENLLRQMALENIETVVSEDIDYKEQFLRMDVNQLSELIKAKKGVPVFGKKKKLVKLAILNNVVPFDSESECKLSKLGIEFLDEHEWIKVYDECLDKFEFNDIYRFCDLKENYISIMLDLLNQYMAKAIENDNIVFLDDCYCAKSNIYEYIKDYDACLNEALKRAIIRLNPICSFDDFYQNQVFEDDFLEIISKEDNIEDVFNNVWDNLDLDKYYVSKDVAFDYLTKALKSDDLHSLSCEYYEKYLCGD